jgi:hypothetical protein
MKSRHFTICAFALAALAFSAHAADAGFKSLFNGKDLSGWEGLKEFWSVRDGAITGQTTAEKQLPSNSFLVWQGGDVKNFELRAKFRLVPNNDKNWANSGIQYRSHVIDPANFVVGGYQADMDSAGQYTGMLYEEQGRGILMKPGQKIRVGPLADGAKKGKEKATIEVLATVTPAEQLSAAYKKADWNEIVIIANGNHLQHFINGKLTADVTDTDDTKGAKSGVLALQLHKGPAMTIQFKDIQLKTLP